MRPILEFWQYSRFLRLSWLTPRTGCTPSEHRCPGKLMQPRIFLASPHETLLSSPDARASLRALKPVNRLTTSVP